MASVYLIDDDADGSEVVAQFLENAGHTVHQSSSPRGALSNLPVILPDVMILDVRMPHMDGFAFLEELRMDYWGARLPVILLTGVSDPDVRWRAAQMGVERVFLKGDYDLAELASRVEELAAVPAPSPAMLQHVIALDCAQTPVA